MKITAIRDIVVSISSSLRNACIDFSTMTASVVAVFTDVVRDGRPVVGFGFNSNSRFANNSPLVDSRVRLPDVPGLGFEAKSAAYAILKPLAADAASST